MSEAEFITLVTKQDPKRKFARWIFGGWIIALGIISSYQTIRELLSNHAHWLHGVGVLLTLAMLFMGIRGLIETSRDHTIERLDVHRNSDEINAVLDCFLQKQRIRRKQLDLEVSIAIGTGFDRTELLTFVKPGLVLYSVRSAQTRRISWPLFHLSRLRKALKRDLLDLVIAGR